MNKEKFCQSLIGEEKENVFLVCKFLRHKIRISFEDGVPNQKLDYNIDYNRINFKIESNRIVTAYFG